LTALAEPEVSSFAIVASCDLLALAPPLLDPLLRGGAPPVQAVVFRDAQLQPFPGLYHRSLLPLIETRLGQESRSIRDLLAHAATTVVPLPPGIPRVAQANTPADLPPFSRSQRKVRRKWLAAGFDDQSGDPGRRRRPSR